MYSTHTLQPPVSSVLLGVCVCVRPVYARALDAQQDAQVDAGPAWIGLTTVAARVITRHTLHPLQHTLSPDAALPRLTGRVDAAGGGRRRPVQTLKEKIILSYS